MSGVSGAATTAAPTYTPPPAPPRGAEGTDRKEESLTAAAAAKAAAVAANAASSMSSAAGAGAKPADAAKPAESKAWYTRAWDATRDIANKVWQWMKNIFYACFPCFGRPKQVEGRQAVAEFVQFLNDQANKDVKDVTAKFAELFKTEEQAVIKSLMGKDADKLLSDVTAVGARDAVKAAVFKFAGNRALTKLVETLSKKDLNGDMVQKAWRNLHLNTRLRIEDLEKDSTYTIQHNEEHGYANIHQLIETTISNRHVDELGLPKTVSELALKSFVADARGVAPGDQLRMISLLVELNPTSVAPVIKKHAEALLAPSGHYHVAPAVKAEAAK